MNTSELLLVSLVGAGYLASLLFVFRSVIGKGLILNPFVTAQIYFLFSVSPYFFLGPMLVSDYNYFPVLVFVLAYIFILAGYYTTPFFRVAYRQKVHYHVTYPAQRRYNRSFGLVALTALLVALGLRFFGGMPPTVDSLIALISGDLGELGREVQRSRLELTKGAYFGGEDRGQGWNTSLQQIGWTLLIARAAAGCAKDRTLVAATFLLVALVGSWIFVAGTGARAPFLKTVFAGIIAYSYWHPLRVSRLILILPLILIIGVFLSSYSHKASGFSDDEPFALQTALNAIVERLALGNSENDVFAILLAQDGTLKSQPGEYHFRNFVSAIPGVRGGMPLSYHLTEILGGGSTTFRSGSYISTVYVDFGLLGVCVVFFVVGLSLKIIGGSILSGRRTPWAVAVGAVWVSNSSLLITGGYHSLIATSVLTISVLAFVIFSDALGRVFSDQIRSGKTKLQVE